MDNNITLEAAVAQLEQLVNDLENKPMMLRDSVNTYKKAQELLTFCFRELNDIKGEITDINEELLRLQGECAQNAQDEQSAFSEE
ncbi:MAG: exodeoxyribonuclease VII small subunit [Ruminococcus sp.]|nr:exodeoxyribonuclease VII small subunit [Ruminococcus sp.]